MIQFEREAWSDLEVALRREWLETNGLGGFASSTIVGLNTRRYHGLLGEEDQSADRWFSRGHPMPSTS
jgi:hypothetical protein